MSDFQHIVGNEQIKAYLTHMVQKNAVGNSLLFAGPDGIGKGLFALALAKMLICKEDPSHNFKIDAGTHPDIHIYRPSGKLGLHSIESMRLFSEQVYMAPYEAKWKIFIIHDADRMLPYSSNALLKTFEEPTTDSLIVLLSSSPESLLPTVLSRCRTLYFQPLKKEEMTWKEQRKEQNAETNWTLILNALAAGRFNSYQELQKFAAEVGEMTEQIKTQVEESARQDLLAGAKENFTASQQQAIEKEIEGAVSMRYVEEVDAIFNCLLGWYRDLHLLQVKGDPTYLMHGSHKDLLEKTLTRGALPALEEVQKMITQTKLSIQRSSALNTCLESLFLKLNFL